MGKNLSRIYSGEIEGIEARLIEVEVDINVGNHSFNIVGLADKSLNEARDRVNAALKNSNIKPPSHENRRITVNLAPADIKKTGSQYDLAIAIGYLLATQQILTFDPRKNIFLGELALDGRLRPINGSLNIAQMALSLGFDSIFLPRENAQEASVVQGIKIVAIDTLRELIDIIENKKDLNVTIFKKQEYLHIDSPDFSEIKGQHNAKRAMIIAAAGGHNILMVGPPGVGKSFLASAVLGVMPKLTMDEAIEVTKIWSAAGLRPSRLIQARPFRAPHSTASAVAVIGGGQDPRPGEISLAHRGILFLDELPEFQKKNS
jgi:magnesium chelatase family protein